MFSISVNDIYGVQEWLASLPGTLHTTLLAKSNVLTAALRQKVDENLSGGVLQSKSGLLRDSISDFTQSTGDDITAGVSVSGDVPYAAIQEYGGTTKAHIIEATNAKALAFSMNGKQVFAKYINHPGSVIPEHAYLRSALEDMDDEIMSGLEEGLKVIT
jgi:phage gpG-like protein